jgi:hypothetical protein
LTLTALTPVLTGCDLLNPAPVAPPRPDPLIGMFSEAQAMVSRYDAAIRAFGSLSAQLTPLRDAHQAHATALAAIMKPAPSTAAVASGAAASPPPGDAKAALATLRAFEQSGAKMAIEACVAATAARATLLGEIAAARASHLEVLR